MSLLVDTSVWPLALRRDQPALAPEVEALKSARQSGESIVTTGLVLQEILQGFSGRRDRAKIIERFAALAFLTPDRVDRIAAAEYRSRCRRTGVQIGTIDALLAQLCIRYELVLLSTDRDFTRLSKHTTLRLWTAAR